MDNNQSFTTYEDSNKMSFDNMSDAYLQLAHLVASGRIVDNNNGYELIDSNINSNNASFRGNANEDISINTSFFSKSEQSGQKEVILESAQTNTNCCKNGCGCVIF